MAMMPNNMQGINSIEALLRGQPSTDSVSQLLGGNAMSGLLGGFVAQQPQLNVPDGIIPQTPPIGTSPAGGGMGGGGNVNNLLQMILGRQQASGGGGGQTNPMQSGLDNIPKVLAALGAPMSLFG